MDEVSAALISKALEGLYQRYQFTAQNIANANSPDYRPVTVSFEESLAAASHQGLDAIRHVAPSQHAVAAPAGQSTSVRLDLELATASQTAMRYKALIELMGRQMALSRTAITEWGR